MGVITRAGCLLVFLLILLSGCGSINGSSPNGGSTKVGDGGAEVVTSKLEINIFNFEQKNVLQGYTTQDAAKTKELYQAMYALPKAHVESMICTMEAGPTYELIIWEGTKKRVVAKAERYGCKVVTIGKDDKRVGDKQFWERIDELMPQNTLPKVQPEKLDVIMTEASKVPTAALVTDAQKISRLYDAIDKLPQAAQKSVCNASNVGYQLTFMIGQKTIFANLDKQCSTVTVEQEGVYNIRADVRTGDKAFWELVEQTVVGEKFENVQPDKAMLSAVDVRQDNTASKDGKDIQSKELMEKLFTKLSTLPVAQGDNTCTEKNGTKGYFLTFQHGVRMTVLSASLPSFECTTISVTSLSDNNTAARVLKLDQETRDLILQAEKG